MAKQKNKPKEKSKLKEEVNQNSFIHICNHHAGQEIEVGSNTETLDEIYSMVEIIRNDFFNNSKSTKPKPSYLG